MAFWTVAVAAANDDDGDEEEKELYGLIRIWTLLSTGSRKFE